MYKLENELVKVELSLHAAEIISFFDKETASERMYQPVEGFWSGRNPILFPQISSTETREYYTKGKKYSMGNHGFTRNSEFVFEYQIDNEICLSLTDNEETYKQYPYHFKLMVYYTLLEKKLNIRYVIENRDEESLYFGFGLHPAFKCPVFENEKFEDYHLAFPCLEEQTNNCKDFLVNKKIEINRELFKKAPTVIYENLNSPFVELRNGNHGVRVDCSGYPLMAFWTPGEDPFICLEPWMSDPVSKYVCDELKDRSRSFELKNNKFYTFCYGIEVF
jgi:galactose mutarotase-like enzyme